MPHEGQPERELTSRHGTCNSETRIRVPRELPSRAVRRVVCSGCERAYEAADVLDRGSPGLRLPLRLPRPDRRWLGLPLAALAVFGILGALRGDRPVPVAPNPDPPESAAAPGPGRAAPKPAPVPGGARMVSGATFTVALPAGWERVEPPAGATFAAASPDGRADATLWVQRDPGLDFATFEANSLAQLESLVGSSKVVERNPGPSPEASSIKIAPASAPAGAPAYEVILRSAGANWYYLATTRQARAGAADARGVELIQGSFLPLGAKG